MLSNISNKERKTILFIRKELLLPDFGVFKRLNELYWAFIFNFFILKAVKKYRNSNLLVISDYQNKLELAKHGIEARTFGSYLKEYRMEKIYWEAKELIKKWFNYDKLRGRLDYYGIDLSYILDEELSWLVSEKLEAIEIAREIIKKEKPKEVLLQNKSNVWGACCDSTVKSYNVHPIIYGPALLEWMGHLARRLSNRFSLAARFYRLPAVDRREFVKSGNLGRIKNKENNVLVLGTSKMYYDRIGSVADELRKSGRNNVIVLAQKLSIQKELSKQKLNFVTFGDFLSRGIKQKINKRGGNFRDIWRILEKDKKFKMLFSYLGVDLWAILNYELFNIFLVKFNWFLYYIETAKELLSKMGINSVVTICDFIYSTRAVVLAANLQSIPTLIVQQGLQVDERGRFFLPLTCKKMAVWGSADKKYMERLGINSKRLVVTGSSLYDNIAVKKSIDKGRKKEIITKLNLDENKETILFASQAFGGMWGEKEREKILEFIIGGFKDIKDKQVIIKLHPREEEGIPNAVMEKLKPKNVVITKKEFSISELIMLADVMITVSSTVVYDAIILGKPVIIVNIFNRPEPVQYVKSGACMGVYKERDFAETIRKINEGAALEKMKIGRKKFIREYLYRLDGKASRRTASLINKMVKENKQVPVKK